MKRIAMLTLALFCCAALASAVDAFGAVTAEDLAGHRFILQSANGKQVPQEREIYFQVDEKGMISGRICNRFRGNGEIRYDRITMQHAVSTRMACPDAGLSDLENRFLRLMERGMAIHLVGDELTLRRDDLIMVFTRFSGLYADEAAPAKNPAAEGAAAADQSDAKAEAAPAPVAAADLVGRKFILSTVSGKEFKAENAALQPFIAFADDMRVNGSACNGFSGPGELADGVLTVRNAAATMKMCVDAALSQFERDFHQLLRNGAKLSLDDKGNLTLAGDDIVLVYIPE